MRSDLNVGPLHARQLTALAAVAETLIPRGGPFPLGATDVDVAGRFNRYLTAFDATTRRQIGLLLAAWEYSPLVSRHLRRFSRLRPADRGHFVEAALRSRYPWRRVPITLLRQLCSFAYGAAPEVEAAFGFDHTCLGDAPLQKGPRLAPLAYPEIRGNVVEHADVCVIGSGAGGAVVAKELAEAGRSVLLIEEGAYFTQDDFQGPPFERVLRTYRDQATTVAYGRPLVPVPLGKAVGGTTVINSGTCFRTPDRVLQHWESAYGLAGYDSAALTPLFERAEGLLNVMPVPWEIIGKNAEVFDRGVRALGLHGKPIRRSIRGCRGCGLCAFGCSSDAKQAMHLSYLPLAAAHGARIFARCRADRLLVKNGRAVGVEATILDRASDEVRGALRVHADTLIVAAGAIHTPMLLRASGVGGRSGQLGRNLRLHPALGVSAQFDEELCSWRGTLQSYFVDHLAESEGVMIEVTNPIPGMNMATGRTVGRATKEALARFRHMAVAGLFVSDSSSGRVLYLGRHRRPMILYALNRHDTRRLIRGMALASEIFLAAGARSVHVGLPGLEEVKCTADLDELRAAERWAPDALSPTAFHPMGTCRMGPNPDSSVVNLGGQVHDVQGLYVADASLFPSCVGVNPQLSIMAFATRIAQGIAGGNGWQTVARMGAGT
jgi:choline dehydrogenase-like flavoprotein